jgi:hypothetical protein
VADRSLTWRSVDLIIVVACLILGIWYGMLGYLDKPAERIRGADSFGYYVYLPSLFMDGDLDLTNDFKALSGPETPVEQTSTGRAGNIFSVGPAILWTPWFGLGHLAAIVSGNPTDGFSKPYQFFVYLGNSCYAILGLILTGRLLKSFGVSPRNALIATLSILFTTQLTYYSYPKSATSHVLSFTTMAAFSLSIRTRGVTWQSGLLGGLAALVRWQNFLFLPLLATAAHIAKYGLKLSRDDIRSYLPFGLAAMVAFLPQVITWHTIYGVPFLVPQDEGYVELTRLPVLKVLFSLRHGLVTWHPWWLLATVGLLITKSRSTVWIRAFTVCLVAQTITNATVLDWWGNWSFGNRRFLNALPLFALGIAYLADHLDSRRKRTLIGVLIVLGVWNQAFVFQYQRALIPRNGPPTWTEFFDDKFSLNRVWRTQLAVNTAVSRFRQDDFENYLKYAKEAADFYPNYRNTMKVHSVVAAVEGRWGEALGAYEGWLEIEPTSRAARWGIADIRLKLGQPDQAREIMQELEVDDKEVLEALASEDGTLLTKSFFNQYRVELDQIYTE